MHNQTVKRRLAALPHMLISDCIIQYVDSISSLVSKSEISSTLKSSVTTQSG